MITIKEEFLSSPKLRRAVEIGGLEALALWLFLKSYAAQNASDGFVPNEELSKIGAGFVKKPEKTIEALRDCGKLKRDGCRGAGLVEQEPHGWQLHDYTDHANSQTDEELRRERARVKKQRQRAEREEELKRLRDATSPGRVPLSVPGTRGDNVPRDDGDVSRDVSGGRSAAGGGAPARARARAGSQPSPAQPSPLQPQPPDAVAPSESPDPNKQIRCPVPLPIPDSALAGLDLDVGMPHDVALVALRDWARDQSATSNVRNLDTWISWALKSVRGQWSDRYKRAVMREAARKQAPDAPESVGAPRVKTYADIQREEAAAEAAADARRAAP